MSKSMSTFDRLSRDGEWKRQFDTGYNEFLLSEFIVGAMDEQKISVRKLASAAGTSPTTIQNIRSGETENVKIGTLMKILNVLNYELKFEKKVIHE